MSAPSHSVWTVIVAGGSGQRFGGLKQFQDVGGKPMMAWAIESAQQVSEGVVLVVPAGHVSSPIPNGVTHVVEGGQSRSESVRRGLGAVPEIATVICVHDAARPFATVSLFERVIEAVGNGVDAAIPGIAVTDTVKEVDDAGRVVATPNRAALRAVQTPQAFVANVLRAAHAGGAEGTDDAAVVEAAGGYVVVVEGEQDNRKVTTPDDLTWARQKMSNS